MKQIVKIKQAYKIKFYILPYKNFLINAGFTNISYIHLPKRSVKKSTFYNTNTRRLPLYLSVYIRTTVTGVKNYTLNIDIQKIFYVDIRVSLLYFMVE